MLILFFILLPFFLVPIFVPQAWRWTSALNRIWANLFFSIGLFRYQVEYRFDKSLYSQYIFCPNHFSYLDIPAMGLNKVDAVFVGKNDMEKIPLFGFMYKRLHITVNRKSLKSKYDTLIKSKKAIDDGKSLMIFPEGGIVSSEPPKITEALSVTLTATYASGFPVCLAMDLEMAAR